MKAMFLLIGLAGVLIWLFVLPQSIQQKLTFSKAPATSGKCTTASGRIYYGDVPAGVSCKKTELVEDTVTILKSRQEPATMKPAPMKLQNRTTMRCDGRTHCSEMRSCEEAVFFLNNCPSTKMDGDLDGVPCEKQWCG